jgi:DNA helicase II / ATP-dependent DNA helicase PcrA
MTPTLEQTDILFDATELPDNLLVIARAGAAKTTTLCLIAEAVAPLPTLCLAFNKKIATELTTRLPSTAKAQTLHSLGLNAWRGFTGKSPKISDKKCFFLVKTEFERLSPVEREELGDDAFMEALTLVREAKSAGYLPAGVNKLAKPLLDLADFAEELEEEHEAAIFSLVDAVLRESFLLAIKGEIDFDDMVYLPALMPVSFPSYPLTMIDEAQDLSLLNHVLLSKIVKKARLIAVGDPCQAIYGFRGASENSMEELAQRFQMKKRFLTVCFRSSEAVVRNARWRAPDMQWGPRPPEGTVSSLDTWSSSTFALGDAIICRNNAPLFSLAIRLLEAGQRPELSSGDIVGGLLKVMKKLGKKDTSVDEAWGALDEWRAGQEKKSRVPRKIEDQVLCIRVFLEKAKTLGEAMDLLQTITSMSGSIYLMTGHKSKGLEFDRVFFLDRKLCKAEGQDLNIRYVIETRAKRDLIYIESVGFKHEAGE